MSEHQPLGSLDHLLGDKVRIRAGPHTGQRGVICAMSDTEMTIEIAPDMLVCLPRDGMTNYSLAARRAWKKMPKRAGRPRLPTARKKMVSIRIDTDLWVRLGQAAELGLIPNREQAVNRWLKEKLVELFRAAQGEFKADTRFLDQPVESLDHDHSQPYYSETDSHGEKGESS